MASRKTEDLTPQMQQYVHAFKSEAKSKGLDILIYCTFRSNEEQAMIWRQGRSKDNISDGIDTLKELGRPDLAKILDGVGPQYGEIVTAALPGQSPHQYGMAFDGAPLSGGKIIWDEDEWQWRQYRDIAHSVGLKTLSWEYPHCEDPDFDWREMIKQDRNNDYYEGYKVGWNDAILEIIKDLEASKI